jgi:hypothetical protein
MRGSLASAVVLALVLTSAPAALACEDGTFSIFGCDASHGRKFIELCGPSPIDASGFLVYRFGSIVDERDEVELSFPSERTGSLPRFYAATYTHHGVYTQSVRFVSGQFSYTVFTKAKGMEELGAGVEVRDRRSGKKTIVECSERPRFYIYELKGLVGCDPETPIGKACIGDDAKKKTEPAATKHERAAPR